MYMTEVSLSEPHVIMRTAYVHKKIACMWKYTHVCPTLAIEYYICFTSSSVNDNILVSSGVCYAWKIGENQF